MAFYTLFMFFGPEKNFELISGRFGEKLDFGPFCPFFRPQKVFFCIPSFFRVRFSAFSSRLGQSKFTDLGFSVTNLHFSVTDLIT